MINTFPWADHDPLQDKTTMTVLFFLLGLTIFAIVVWVFYCKIYKCEAILDNLMAISTNYFSICVYDNFDMHFILSVRVIYLLCFLFYIKLNLKMWMRDGVMTKLAWKFGSITVLIVISALDHLIQQPSGKRKWLILIYLLIPVLWYLHLIGGIWGLLLGILVDSVGLGLFWDRVNRW